MSWNQGHGAKNTQIRWEACGGLECWLSPGSQSGTSSTTLPTAPRPTLGWRLYPCFPTPNPPSTRPPKKENLPL